MSFVDTNSDDIYTSVPDDEDNKKRDADLRKENEQFKNQVQELKTQYHDLVKENEHSKSKQENDAKILAELKYKLSEIGNQIENAKKNNKNLNVDEIKESCKRIIQKFITTQDENSDKILLTVKVKYENMVFIKRIEDESMDFARMKLDLTKQIDISQNEFFFVDEKDCLLIDELNVKKSLFPFSDSKIRNYEPTIKIIEAGKSRK